MKQLLLSEIKYPTGSCFKCGSTKNVIKHHIKYNPEIIVDCCQSCHKKIHYKVRKKGLCPLSVEETARLSHISYNKRHSRRISFRETMELHVYLLENIDYHPNNGTVSYSSCFLANNNTKMYYLKEVIS